MRMSRWRKRLEPSRLGNGAARVFYPSMRPSALQRALEMSRTKKTFPLACVYGLLESGPVVLVTTSRKGRFNVMPMS